MKNVRVVRHPLIAHALSVLRERSTSTAEFRRHAAIISQILFIELTKGLPLRRVAIRTPLIKTSGQQLRDGMIVVPVLRSGLAMLHAIEEYLPSMQVGFIGLERDEKTAVAREYYAKIPTILRTHSVVIVDPMLATGGSLDDTISAVKARAGRRIAAMCIVASPEGIARIERHHPEVQITTAAVDRSLNKQKFIVPGLGDFGDRFYGTDRSAR